MRAQLDLFMLSELAEQHAADQEASKAARDEGIERARAHAETDLPTWGERASAWALWYARDVHPRAFNTMECRKLAYAYGLPRPPNEFAWGAVMVRLLRARLIERVGVENVGDKTSHVKLTPLWRAIMLERSQP